MDFIKALDTINHDLLIAKLHAFNFDNSNLKPPCSYLNDRWLTTKIEPNFILLGSWKICPWSIPFLYFCFKRFIVLLSVLICATLQMMPYFWIAINIFSFYLGFLSQFTNYRTAGEQGGHFFNYPLPLPPASRILRHQPGNYCRELTSAHSQRPDSNHVPLVSELKSLTTTLCAL